LIDARVARLAIPVRERAPLADRAVRAWRELVSTPRRAALATIGCVALVVAVVCAIPTTRAVRTALGPARAHCGLDIFVYGYPDHGVRSACRSAESARLALFLPAALVALVVLGAGLWLSIKAAGRPLLDAVRQAPARAALVLAGLVAIPAGVGALRPSIVDFVGPGSLTTAHCGADAYFFGYPDPVVLHACRRAYAGHAHVLEISAVVVATGLAATLHMLYSRARSPADKRRLLLAGTVVILAVAVAAALRPVTVRVGQSAPAVYATCGLDTFVAGYPDATVQHACRPHLRMHAAGGLAAVFLILVAAGGAALLVPRQRTADVTEAA
jgi:hypothetical protein